MLVAASTQTTSIISLKRSTSTESWDRDGRPDCSNPMKVLISSAGSHGDVLPYIAIGREMRARGHEIVLLANPYFRDYVIAAADQHDRRVR